MTRAGQLAAPGPRPGAGPDAGHRGRRAGRRPLGRSGDKDGGDRAAIDTMRKLIAKVPMRGEVMPFKGFEGTDG